LRHVFADESCQNAHHYMVLGALILPGTLVQEAETGLRQVLESHRMHGELKWTKVSRGKLPVYEEFVAHYFDVLVPRGAEFHSLILNCHGLNHRKFNNGDPDLGYNKFMFQLLFHRAAVPYGEYEKIVADLDSRNSNRNPYELETILNSASSRKFDRQPFTRVAHRDSKGTRLLQLADLLTGAVAWHKNDHDAAENPSAAKCSLATTVANCAGRLRLGNETPKTERRMGVWNFRLR